MDCTYIKLLQSSDHSKSFNPSCHRSAMHSCSYTSSKTKWRCWRRYLRRAGWPSRWLCIPAGFHWEPLWVEASRRARWPRGTSPQPGRFRVAGTALSGKQGGGLMTPYWSSSLRDSLCRFPRLVQQTSLKMNRWQQMLHLDHLLGDINLFYFMSDSETALASLSS